jgi:hypothetical protein
MLQVDDLNNATPMYVTGQMGQETDRKKKRQRESE